MCRSQSQAKREEGDENGFRLESPRIVKNRKTKSDLEAKSVDL